MLRKVNAFLRSAVGWTGMVVTFAAMTLISLTLIGLHQIFKAFYWMSED